MKDKDEDVTSLGDVYLEDLTKQLKESKEEYEKLLEWNNKISENNLGLIEENRDLEVKLINLKSRANDWIADLNSSEEARLKLVKIKNFLQDKLREQSEEVKNLKAEVKYERQLRVEGAKHH